METVRRTRNWCFTINNWTPELYDDVIALTNYKYLIMGKEIGEKTKTPHIQGFIVFKYQKTLTQVRRSLPRAHLTAANGTVGQNVEYCSKDGDYEEWGERPMSKKEQGEAQKNLYAQAWELAKQGRIEEIPEGIRVRCYNQIKRIEKDFLKPCECDTKVVVYWGETGSGKSHKAHMEAGVDGYWKIPTTKFWDGYDGQENVVIDEYRGKIDIAHMLRWCDKYPCTVEVKGGATALAVKKMWITSNIHPREWYPDLDEPTLQALLRRLEIYEFQIEKTLDINGQLTTNYHQIKQTD